MDAEMRAQPLANRRVHHYIIHAIHTRHTRHAMPTEHSRMSNRIGKGAAFFHERHTELLQIVIDCVLLQDIHNSVVAAITT